MDSERLHDTATKLNLCAGAIRKGKTIGDGVDQLSPLLVAGLMDEASKLITKASKLIEELIWLDEPEQSKNVPSS